MASNMVQQLIDSGIHFGHKASRWNPKMKPYILGKRNSVHLINLRETVRGLLQAKKFIANTVSRNQSVLFVGTKRQAKQAVQSHAQRVGMHYVAERWLGGTLTNFRTIRARLSRLVELEEMDASGLLKKESKKTQSRLQRERRKILRNLEGIRDMSKLPGVVVVIDASHERNAILEARKLGLPSICLIDTDSDPDLVDIPIPGNDDALRAIDTIVAQLADAVEEGKRARPPEEETGPRERKRSSRPSTSQLAEENDQPPADAPKPAQDNPSTKLSGEQTPAVAYAESTGEAAHATGNQN